MSLEQFFLPPQEWCESKINENCRFFHLFSQKTVGSLNKIVYGLSFHSHSPEEIAAELQAVKSAISNGNWQDPCCDLKEQLTAWAKEKNITV